MNNDLLNTPEQEAVVQIREQETEIQAEAQKPVEQELIQEVPEDNVPIPEATGEPESADETEVSSAPESVDETQVSAAPESVDETQVSAAPEPLEGPEDTEEPGNAEEPEPTDKPDIPDATEGAADYSEDAPGDDESENPNPEPKKKKNRLPLILALIVVLLGAVYGGGYYYYSSHFPHAITGNGLKLGELTVDEAEKVFTEDLKSHNITLKEKEREETISAASIGTVIDVGTQVQDLFDSLNPALWFTNMFGQKDTTLKLDVTYDKEAMKNLVDSLECFKKENIIPPASAYIEAGKEKFELVPEVLGNTVLKDKLISAIDDALSTCKTSIDLEEQGLYKLPKYYADDQVVKDALETCNTYTKGTIVHDFTYTTETLDYRTTKKWISVSKDFKVTLSSSDVGDYVESLGKKYNTMGSARPFTTANGSHINVYNGDYGWRIDFKKEKKKLIKEIKSGKDVNRKPVYSYTAAIQTKETDIGDSYVEVSISAQELWLFIDGHCIMNTSVVTGRPKFDTEKGVYSITYKKRNETLEGYNADGTPYASAVSYWMPFNGNQGLHDASWRDSFGGNIYKTNGSHGCVNCPTWAAATLYQYVKENFPVIIY